MKKMLALLLVLALALGVWGCQFPPDTVPPSPAGSTGQQLEATTGPTTPALPPIDRDGVYNSKEDVALYIHTYGCLPDNYVTKSEAKAMGCKSLGRIGDYLKHGAIGGDVFHNREGLLPSQAGRTYYECDIDTWNKTSRGAKRIVFSSDGLIYYTDDHYRSFTLLYGEP